MSFIDASYFVAELSIPNSGELPVSERITWFIEKYEPLFLQRLLGYPLYKAFVAGMNVSLPATPAQRFLDLLYGKEYTDIQGYIQQWRGIIVTDSPVFNISGNLVYKKPVYLTAGVTLGLTPGTNTATFDGTGGKDDWRGWVPVITRAAVMKPGVDYSWDKDTGILLLLRAGDKFGPLEDFFAEFELRTDGLPAISLSANESLIANFVYYWYYRSAATQSTGIGEVQASAENSVNVSPRQKMLSAWNEMHQWVKEFTAFMESTQFADPTIYPEWTNINKIDALRYFGFINPIF